MQTLHKLTDRRIRGVVGGGICGGNCGGPFDILTDVTDTGRCVESENCRSTLSRDTEEDLLNIPDNFPFKFVLLDL